jgi:hypothetical protein
MDLIIFEPPQKVLLKNMKRVALYTDFLRLFMRVARGLVFKIEIINLNCYF